MTLINPPDSCPPSSQHQSLVSRSSILILSGVLIGMGVQGGIATEIKNYVYMAGLLGLMAFVALDAVAKRSKQKAAERAAEQASSVVENRIHRMIPAEHRDKSLPTHCKPQGPGDLGYSHCECGDHSLTFAATTTNHG